MKVIIFITLFAVLILVPDAHSRQGKNNRGYPQHDYILIPTFDANKIKVRIQAKCLHDNLIFYKKDKGFSGTFILEYVFYSMNDQSRVHQRNLEKEIELDTYALTNSRKEYSEIDDETAMIPDDYRISIKGYTDNGRKELFAYSDTLYWDIEKQIAVSYSYIQNTDKSVFTGQKNIPFGLNGKIVLPLYWLEKNRPDSLSFFVYTKGRSELIWKKTIDAPKETKFLEIPGSIEKLPEGKYQLYVVFNKNRQVKRTFRQNFIVEWLGKPWSLSEIGLALKPLRAILGDDFEKTVMNNSDSDLKSFNSYWKKADPTPETEYNEIQAEFYQRADEVQRKFGSERKYGWDGDLGLIYLKYGEPDEVNDQHLNPFGDEYVEWTYTSVDKKFVFVFDGKEYKLRKVLEIKD